MSPITPEPDRPSASSGFEIYERLLAEATRSGGVSATQAGWTRDALERLAALRQRRPSPSDERALSRIEKAFREAESVLARCLAKAPPASAPPQPASQPPKRPN